MDDNSTFENVCRFVNYRSIAEYACCIQDGRDATVIERMLSWMVTHHNLCDEELNRCIQSIGEAHDVFRVDYNRPVSGVPDSGCQKSVRMPGLGLPARIALAPERQ